MGGEVRSLARKTRSDLLADPSAAAGVRGIADQLMVSELHVGNESALLLCDTSGTAVATFNSSGAHSIGKAGQTTSFPGSVSITGTVLGVDRLAQTITQTSHGFSAGQVLRHNGTIWVTAQANSAANAEAVGVIESVTTHTFVLVLAGYISGLSGFTAGVAHFLSASSAGALTATEPTATTQVSKSMLIAISTSAGYVVQHRGYLIP